MLNQQTHTLTSATVRPLVVDRVPESARNWQNEFLTSADPEQTLFDHLDAFSAMCDRTGASWQPGSPLKLLLAGYSGAGNVGTEMRTGEILRQLRHLLGERAVEFTALSMSPALPQDVLPGVSCLRLGAGYIPDVILRATQQHHGTIACEGSMFKSTFANVLSAIMAAALGMASRSGKLSIGYGAEVSHMDPLLEEFVRDQVGQSLVVCRNEPSLLAATALGLRAELGADTAWTFAASPRETAVTLLRGMGWNGSDPILTICPMNPFWWPVQPSPRMALELQRSGAHKERHFASVFFHSSSPEIDGKYRRYIGELAHSVRELIRIRSAFPVVVAMDRVDRQACSDLIDALGRSAATIVGGNHPVGDVIAVLRTSDLLISSRFHALVGAMPAGVPSIGIAMDERIANLLSENGQSERLLAADDPEVGHRILAVASRLHRTDVEKASRRTVGDAIVAIGRMGDAFVRELHRVLPEFPLPARLPTWTSYVAPLPSEIEEFLS